MAKSKKQPTSVVNRAFYPYMQILRSTRYRPLWFGQVVSNLGDTFHYIALVVLLFRLTDSGAALTVLALAQIAVTIAVGPIAGMVVVVDSDGEVVRRRSLSSYRVDTYGSSHLLHGRGATSAS